ncbi:MAG: ankyrin repeat domain-containing protein [Treponema sp.]|nr:ankyrin repeat domain-containing protein [Treponema sp.]
MKILLLYAEEDPTVLLIKGLLEGMEIEVDPLLFVLPRNSKKITGIFSKMSQKNPDEHHKKEGPSHVVILSSLAKEWCDFLAGFACGSHIPLLIYGDKAIPGISREFSHFFTFLGSEETLRQYFETENEAYTKLEAARTVIRAQDTLLRMGVPVTGESLAQCISENRTAELAHFMAAGFSPNTRNKAGVPLLNIAARSGADKSLRFLINAKADLNARSEDRGTSALMDSVMAKQYTVMAALLKAGSDPDIQSKDGQTALVVAVGAGNEKMTEALLKAHANADISDSLGASARKYAFLFKKPSIVALFNKLSPAKT